MAAFLILFSCEDEDKVRVPVLEKPVSMRLQIDPEFSIVDALDIPNAKLRMDVYTEVSTIDSVKLFLDYYSFGQDSTYDNAFVHSFLGSDFSADGIINAYDLTTIQISDAVGIPLDSMGGGDRLDFTFFTILEDGRMFPDTIPGLDGTLNTTSNILNSASTTSLTTSFTTFIACPVDDDFLVGNFSIVQASGPSDPFFGTGDIIAPAEINIGRDNEISRTFGNLTYATFGGGEINFLLVCNNILIPYGPAPASCGGGLGWIGDNGAIITYDESDDSSFTLNLLHNPTGDCGLAVNEPLVFTVTKLAD